MHSRVVLICTDDTSDIFPLILLIEKKKKNKNENSYDLDLQRKWIINGWSREFEH